MKIPSYDDLTPGISDIRPRETFDQVAHLLPASSGPVVKSPPQAAGRTPKAASSAGHAAPAFAEATAGRPGIPHLFACLRARGATAAGLLSLARDFSPRLERHGDACIVLDVGGLGRLLGDAHGIASALQQAAADRGVKASLAVAPTQTAARLLTLHAGAPVVAGDAASAVAALPLSLLGAIEAPPGPCVARTLDALRRWGVRTLGEFAALPADELAARFGPAGPGLHRLARGLDPRPLSPDRGVTRFVESMELEWPLDALEPLSFVLARLLEPLAAALDRAGKGGAAIRLELRLVDRTTHARMLQLPAPMRDPRVLRTLLLLDLESHPPAAAIDIVTVEIDPAPARIVQFSLLERATPSPETLATLTARLGALVGDDRCGSPVLLDSHRPDAFEMRRFNPDSRKPPGRTPEPPNPGTPEPWNPGTLEPWNPGTLEPWNPGTLEPWNLGTLLLRRFRPPLAVRVSVERGRPARIAIDRRGMPGGRVEQSAGPWRSSGAWWDASGAHWDRDEWDVALGDGSVCRLYCDRTGRWFLEGILD